MKVTPGSTDVTTYFCLRLAADGTEATGLTITNFDLQYVRSGVAPAAKVDATALAATDSAHGDNQAIEIDATDQPGLYRVDWPDAAFAAGVREVILTVKCATCFTEHLRVELETRQTGDSFARLGAPAGASTAADIAAVKVDTAAILADTGTDGVVVASIANNAITAAAIATGAIDADAIADNAIDAGAIAADAITAAKIANGAIDAATFAADVDAEILSYLVDDATRIDASALNTASVTSIPAILVDTGTTLDGAITTIDGIVDAIKAVTDQLVAAQSEPTGVPAANETPLEKLGYLFMALRNKITVTATKKTYYDDGDAAEWEKDLSDDGTTYTESEGNAI